MSFYVPFFHWSAFRQIICTDKCCNSLEHIKQKWSGAAAFPQRFWLDCIKTCIVSILLHLPALCLLFSCKIIWFPYRNKLELHAKLETHLNSEISQIKMRPFLCGMTILSLEEFILKQMYKKTCKTAIFASNKSSQPTILCHHAGRDAFADALQSVSDATLKGIQVSLAEVSQKLQGCFLHLAVGFAGPGITNRATNIGFLRHPSRGSASLYQHLFLSYVCGQKQNKQKSPNKINTHKHT